MEDNYIIAPVVEGQVYEPVVKVGDTTPIGGIIGYDTTQTIPDGWEYYAENQIKKIAPVTPPSGLLTTTYGTSETDGYAQEYINNLHTYSTDEIRIGTYLGKPLYRKVFEIINPSNSNTNYVDVSSLNIETLVHLYGHYKATAGTFGIPFYDSNDNLSVMFVNSANYLRGRFGNNYAEITEAEVVLEYTKTTD